MPAAPQLYTTPRRGRRNASNTQTARTSATPPSHTQVRQQGQSRTAEQKKHNAPTTAEPGSGNQARHDNNTNRRGILHRRRFLSHRGTRLASRHRTTKSVPRLRRTQATRRESTTGARKRVATDRGHSRHLGATFNIPGQDLDASDRFKKKASCKLQQTREEQAWDLVGYESVTYTATTQHSYPSQKGARTSISSSSK